MYFTWAAAHRHTRPAAIQRTMVYAVTRLVSPGSVYMNGNWVESVFCPQVPSCKQTAPLLHCQEAFASGNAAMQAW